MKFLSVPQFPAKLKSKPGQHPRRSAIINRYGKILLRKEALRRMTINENNCEDHQICKNHKFEQVRKSIKVHFPHEEKAKSFSFRLTVPENYGPKSTLKPSTASKGMAVAVPQGHPEEKRMYEVGKRAFFYRAGPYDFSCATCHATDNVRIRLQGLPNLPKAKPAGQAFTSWPAYRVGNGQLWPMQKRLNDCYRQQRFPEPKYGSEVTVALSVYMGVNGNGVKSLAVPIKR